ncbi:hypothetical protein KSP39_PZI005894 [Platanthera zijinensis]|uniref:Uncharacterized protein n=1 Tax=Platanthera zijinensis TaxID=2320716 RepID=A0AAP0GBF9_9ASPA
MSPSHLSILLYAIVGLLPLHPLFPGETTSTSDHKVKPAATDGYCRMGGFPEFTQIDFIPTGGTGVRAFNGRRQITPANDPIVLMPPPSSRPAASSFLSTKPPWISTRRQKDNPRPPPLSQIQGGLQVGENVQANWIQRRAAAVGSPTTAGSGLQSYLRSIGGSYNSDSSQESYNSGSKALQLRSSGRSYRWKHRECIFRSSSAWAVKTLQIGFACAATSNTERKLSELAVEDQNVNNYLS